MTNLQQMADRGARATLIPSFPCVTWPVQSNMVCGCLPNEHGVIGNGFYWRDSHKVEMWTAWNEKIERPQIWDMLREQQKSTAVWFPMLSKGCGADTVCMPAPIHNPDGSESLWCYTKPTDFYGELLAAHGQFPLQRFWGPMAGIESSRWIVESAVTAANRFHSDFFYIYLPHLDYAAQRSGPESPQAAVAVAELDELLGALFNKMQSEYEEEILWLVGSEYAIVPVEHVTYPNRVLREAGFLKVRHDSGEWIDFAGSRAWALVDHQFSHIFIQDPDSSTRPGGTDLIEEVAGLFTGMPGIAEVLAGQNREKYQLHHQRSGEVILISEPHSWQAYYYWLDDDQAPAFARTVDIHQKPGYDPVELHFDPVTRGIPLDTSLVKGSHGAPATGAFQRGVLIASQAEVLGTESLKDHQIARLILDQFNEA
jgi:hypothetical protein